ncbi:polysaccharide deacetylase family protein [Peptoniphilus equinus]|uniref:Polysaccharide deacetylase family protein n=1 Tax=Peptoniphilus equinus TaxID=3016343 RepID=A0ABY7QSZ4_9FIRM|nr:polysaccharide deacetylase family protein [Peptoniphilus equinus]WBW49909.1 polysaccharide deacetylase family protein [Peptoniphilus equinus]
MKRIIMILIALALAGGIYFNFIRTVGPGTIPVLTYHAISDDPGNEYAVAPKDFEAMISGLHDEGFTFLTLNDLKALANGDMSLPNNPVFITFDDGYKDNFTTAYPILKKYGARGSIFIVGSLLGTDGFLDPQDIITMSEDGMAFGSHTYSLDGTFLSGKDKGKTFLSTKLPGETDAAFYTKVKNDLVWNNDVIYQLASIFPFAIAYPGAATNDLALKAVQDSGLQFGFVGANYTATTLNHLKEDPYTIHRFHIKPTENIPGMIRYLHSNNDTAR